MYLKGSKFSMQKRRRRINPFRIILLVVIVAALVYFDRMVIPTIPNMFQATPTATRPAESYVTEAEALEGEGKYAMAISSYKEAVQADPRNPVNFLALARLNVYTGNYAQAVTDAENALLLNPNNDEALALRGFAIGLAGDYLRGVGSLEEALTVNGNNAAAYAFLAELYVYMLQVNQGDLTTMDKAIAASKSAISLAPNTLETHRGRGFVLEYTANFEEAAAEFEAAIAINPNIADLHLALGRNYFYLQEYDPAITEFNKANALNPKDPTPESLIARTYQMNGDYAKAIQYAQAALMDDPVDPYLYGNLGLVYWKNKQYLDSVDMLRIAVRGGVSADGQTVNGLPMDYGKVEQFYYTYALALANTQQCGEAIQLAQAIQTGLRNDDIAVYNAQETINICELQAKQGGGLVDSTETPTPEPTPLP